MALKHFMQNVQENPIAKDISKIILFGSLLNKEVHAGSDIDLAVIAKNPKAVEDQIDDLSYEMVLQYGELIEPIIYSTKQYNKPSSPFLMKIIREGREVYTA